MGVGVTQHDSPQKWAVIGGGILGMTTAMRLAQAGHDVTLIESADHLGGMADAWRVGDVTWDRHYHVTLLSDSYTRGILQELDLDQDMKWVETRTGFFTDGRLHSMSSSLEFLLFRPLPLLAKFRLGLTIFAGSKIQNWKKLERLRVEDWLKKWSGSRTWERIWKPLLRSKLGDNYKKTSAAFIWATIQRLYAARRTGLKKEMFGYLPGGYGRMLKSFGGQLSELGVKVRLNENVATVRRENNAVQIRSEDGSLIGVFDRAVATVPSRLISRIMPELSPLERQQHESIQYQGIVCVSLLLKKPLADFYVTNITDAVVPFTGVIEMSALVGTEFGGRSLIYLPYYVPENDKLFDVSDDEIQETSLSGLEAMYPEFKRSDVVACRASRVRRVMPIPTLNYSENVPPMATSIPGVYAVNSVQIVNGTLNVNETVKLAETATANLLLLDQPSENCPKENQHAAAC